MSVDRSRASGAEKPVRRVPIGTWVGIGVTVALSLLALSGGVWSMLAMAALIVLLTALYSTITRRRSWLRLPRSRKAGAIGAAVALVALLGSTSAFGATGSADPVAPHAATALSVQSARANPASEAISSPTPTPTPTPMPTHVSVVTTKTITKTSSIPYASTTVNDPTLAQGTSSITTAGVNGVRTKTYRVTYVDGAESTRVLTGDTTTTPPVTQVTTVGTYVAPAAPTCTNGTYVNSAGNTVCRPEAATSAPAGATARCGDGTYSFSQSRRGTCSSHGGVAAWL